jgi:hypothetical protein
MRPVEQLAKTKRRSFTEDLILVKMWIGDINVVIHEYPYIGGKPVKPPPPEPEPQVMPGLKLIQYYQFFCY